MRKLAKNQTLQKWLVESQSVASPFEPDVYLKVRGSEHFVNFSAIAATDQAFAESHLQQFQEIFKLAVKASISKRIESLQGSTTSSITIVSPDIAISVAGHTNLKQGNNMRQEFESNVAAFKAMEHQLEGDPKYRGKYVVIYNSELVAYGEDRAKLLSEAYKKYGYVSLIVHKVGQKRIMRAYSPRYVRHD